MAEVKHQVKDFYDQIGWEEVDAGVFQNARYEDLRPVSQEYIHKCHMRVNRHLANAGEYFLDAGSGPVQYPEYLTYSENYKYRICADISLTALKAARERVGEHGLYVVADVAYLPFASDSFDGAVSLHTIHHLPRSEHLRAFRGLLRVLKPGSSAVAVNGWKGSPFNRFMKALLRVWYRLRGRKIKSKKNHHEDDDQATGTFVARYNYAWFKEHIMPHLPVQVYVWRSMNVNVMRRFIHEERGGRTILRVLYALEERFPKFFGARGQYPMIVLTKQEKD
jgi:SAM-dependent methyltransferase